MVHALYFNLMWFYLCFLILCQTYPVYELLLIPINWNINVWDKFVVGEAIQLAVVMAYAHILQREHNLESRDSSKKKWKGLGPATTTLFILVIKVCDKIYWPCNPILHLVLHRILERQSPKGSLMSPIKIATFQVLQKGK